MVMTGAGWWRRGRRIPRVASAAARRSPWWRAASSTSRSCATFPGRAVSERAVIESNHDGHLSVVTSDIGGKSRVVAERVRWLMAADLTRFCSSESNAHRGRRRVLVLTGNGALASDESSLRAQIVDTEALYALERQGHGIYSVREFCRLMLEETGRDQRVFGRAKLAAFLLHHRKELPFGRLHRGNATASLQQYRHVSDLLQLFRLLESHGVTAAAFLGDARERQDALSVELAKTYGVYHSLLAKHGVTTWDGVVLELLQLCYDDTEFTASLLRGYTDIVVDDVQSLTPAMVQLVAKLCSHPSILSSTSVSRVLNEAQPCPRTKLLEQLLRGKTSTDNHPQAVENVTLTEDAVQGNRSELLALSQALWKRDKDPKRRATALLSGLPSSSDILQCLEFRTITEEELGIGNLLHQKLSSGNVFAKEVAVLAPTLQDAQRIAHSLRTQGLPVRGPSIPSPFSAPSVVESGLTSSANLFDEPVVNAIFSLLVALCFPSDSRHLYNVLRSDFFEFPAELLSQLMEKEQRSHVDLFRVLEAFVATKGSSLYPIEGQSKEVGNSGERDDHINDIEAGLVTASAFVKLIKSLRAVCHSRSAQEIVHTFLEERGRMESLLNPGSTEEEHEAIVLAEFLRELEGAQRVVQSAYVPLVVPYLMQLCDANRSRGPTSSPSQSKIVSSEDDSALPNDEGIRVLPLTMASLESLAGSNAVSTLVLMSMRDSKFPGRMRRVTLPLPYNLLSEPYPIQSRDEHIERCERLAAFAMTIPRGQVVLSYAAVVSGPPTSSPAGGRAAATTKLKFEQISRVFLPIWQDPSASKPSGKNDDDDTTGTSSSHSNGVAATQSVVRSASPTIKYNPSHVSYTQVSEYLRCPYRYYLARVMKLPGEFSTAMMYGRVLHEAVAEFASALINDSDAHAASNSDEQQQVEAEKRALAAFADSWTANQDDALFSSPDHERVLYEQGVVALEAFFQAHKSEHPRILHVEHPFAVFVPEANVELRGVWDRIDVVSSPSQAMEHTVIKEFKSNVSGAARDMGRQARESLQLKVYMYAFERVFGSLPFGAALQTIGGDDKSNAAGFITSSAASAQEAVDTIATVVSAMRAGEFAPHPNYMECAFCPYASSACRAAGDISTASWTGTPSWGLVGKSRHSENKFT